MANYLDEAGLAELWSLIGAEDESLATDIATRAKIETGSWRGANSTTTSITFGFVPKVVIITGTENGTYTQDGYTSAVLGVWSNGDTRMLVLDKASPSSFVGETVPTTLSGKTLTISSGKTGIGAYSRLDYRYTALG